METDVGGKEEGDPEVWHELMERTFVFISLGRGSPYILPKWRVGQKPYLHRVAQDLQAQVFAGPASLISRFKMISYNINDWSFLGL